MIRSMTWDVMRFKGPNYYSGLLQYKQGKESVATKQIELDLMRTFPTHRDFSSLDSPMISQLRNVLVAFSWHNPVVGYCQGLNMMAAIGLLCLEEEMAFWLLVAVVEQILPAQYFSGGMAASQADQRVLKDLLADRMPKLSAHLEKHSVDISVITFNWLLTTFVDCVPPETVFRIWDAFLYEGAKVPFRFALGLFKMHEAEILKRNDRVELFSYLRAMARRSFDTTALVKASFASIDGYSGFSMKTIQQKRQTRLAEVRSELEELEKSRQEYLSTARQPTSSDGDS
eukprot:m.188605 g.188605  ORF g.188605 m.188605 type:complete len:286 (-) comp10558_c0_seq3:1648-2505(-)